MQELKAKFNIQDMLPIAMTLVVIGIGTAYGLNVLTDVDADFTEETLEDNATEKAAEGLAKLPNKLPLIATVVIAAIVIGILVRYLFVQAR